MLGSDVSERTISRWIRRAPGDPEPAKGWLVFLHNHPTFVQLRGGFGTLNSGFALAAENRGRAMHGRLVFQRSSILITEIYWRPRSKT